MYKQITLIFIIIMFNKYKKIILLLFLSESLKVALFFMALDSLL